MGPLHIWKSFSNRHNLVYFFDIKFDRYSNLGGKDFIKKLISLYHIPGTLKLI